MKKRIILLVTLSALINSASLAQEASGFVNDICLPSRLYLLSGVENNLFVEPMMKRWRPYQDVVRFSGTVQYQRRWQRVASLNAPVDEAIIQIDLINTNQFDTIKTLKSTVEVGIPDIGEDSVTVSIIGDSFTHGGFFKDALLAKGYVPKIRMTGLREVSGFPGQFDEGRGGWTLNQYFRITNGRTDAYNGFWQPVGEARYWGSTCFWKLVHELHLFPDKEWTFGEKYNASRYTKVSSSFDVETGYRLNPRKNDIMYDNDLEYYVAFNGKKWIRCDYNDYNWSFDYGKYLEMWNLKSPSVLFEFLGLNDFRNCSNPAFIDFTKWNEQIEVMVKSYLKAVPEGKFVLMIPSSTCGTLDNTAGDFTIKQNACMWELRKNIIEHFDRRQFEHIYVLDAAISIDNMDGYNYNADEQITKPYAEYPGKNRVLVQTGNPHPYPNYPTMGISVAAFIQRYRK